MNYYEVAVAAPICSTLTYAGPEDVGRDLEPGMSVVVPLGRRRRVTGYVFGRAEAPEQAEGRFTIKPIHEVLSAEPVFPKEHIKLYYWLSRYYHAPIGEVVQAALSAVPVQKYGYYASLNEEGQGGLLAELETMEGAVRPPWCEDLLDGQTLGPVVVAGIKKSAGDRRLLEKLEAKGIVALTHDRVASTGGARMESVYTPSPELALILDELGTSEEVLCSEGFSRRLGRKLKPVEKRALAVFASIYSPENRLPVYRKQILAHSKKHSSGLLSLSGSGLLVKEEQRVYRNPFGETVESAPAPQILTSQQESVLERLLPSITRGCFSPFLLFGVTGCGKTEVYLRAVEQALQMGKTALVLVPEIALAAQMEAGFYSRFGEKLALMHSGLSPGERQDQRRRIIDGEAMVVLGARSAVLAPITNLGVIIVDEEHEPAYKQEDGVRYHGRDVAVMRAKMAECPIVLGSATPSITSFANSKNGKYTLLTMDKRVEERALPEVEVVNLTTERKYRPFWFFSDSLVNAVHSTLNDGRQVLLFVNRRGYSSCMLCRDCGHVVQCRSCQVSLTHHRGKGVLLCHYCGYSLPENVICPECSSDKVEGVGLGVERIEADVKQLCPDARVARLDSDIAANRKKYLQTLKAVKDGEVDILVGTQMIAKGLHFPNITLVGVVWADAGLAMPDYKAAERTFALLSQVTGRAGRGEHPGKVVIQTSQPDHYAVRFAQQHDFLSLYEQETSLRSMLGFPPFSRMINFKFSGTHESRVESAALKVRSFLETCNAPGQVELLGPAPAPLAKIKDRYRWQLLMKGTNTGELHRLCGRVVAEKAKLMGGSVRMGVDVDPENMM